MAPIVVDRSAILRWFAERTTTITPISANAFRAELMLIARLWLGFRISRDAGQAVAVERRGE